MSSAPAVASALAPPRREAEPGRRMSAATVQRLFDALRADTLRAQTDLLASDVVVHAAGYPVSGPAAVQLLAGAAFDAFRDIRISHQIVSDADGQVVASFEARGTQVKPLFGMVPAGGRRESSASPQSGWPMTVLRRFVSPARSRRPRPGSPTAGPSRRARPNRRRPCPTGPSPTAHI